MTKCTVTLHPRGLDPFQSAKAWFLRKKSKLPWKDVRKQVRTVNGQLPGQRALENAVCTVNVEAEQAASREQTLSDQH